MDRNSTGYVGIETWQQDGFVAPGGAAWVVPPGILIGALIHKLGGIVQLTQGDFDAIAGRSIEQQHLERKGAREEMIIMSLGRAG